MTPSLRAELVRITTVRGLWLGALLAALALPVLSLLVASTGGVGAHDTLTSAAATGTIVGLLGFGTWAAAYAASDYAHGSIGVSLALVPRRPTLYAARVGVVALVAGVSGLVAALVSLLVVWAAGPAVGHRLGDPSALLSVVPAYAVVAAVGAAAGFALRATTASIGVMVIILLTPKAAAGLLGGLQPVVIGASPPTVVTQFVGGAQLPSDQAFPGGPFLALIAMAAVGLVIVAAVGVTFCGVSPRRRGPT